MHILILLSTILCSLVCLSFSVEECKGNLTNEYIYHLGTKTPYRIVANVVDEKFHVPDCEPEKIWMVIRHGTRNPSSSNIAKMKQRLPEIRDLILEHNQEPSDYLRNSDLYALQKWKFKVDDAHAQFLTHEGEDEMLELAERMQNRFPTLFPSVYSNTTYFFKFTASQRTKASAQYFATGLFGRNVVKDIWFPTPLMQDPILRFYKLCSKWRNEIKKNLQTLKEMLWFKKSTHMENIIEKLNQDLNLNNGSLVADDIHIMYSMCAFETAWNKRKSSPWCAVLNPHSFKVVEFLEDLKYYYVDGYGHQLTHQQACPAFNDMLSYFNSNSPYPKSTIYFTHSGTILKMLAHLGLYNDNRPLLHTDFVASDHQWKVSKIDAFGSNIAFVLNRCGDKRHVMVLHQERVVRLPGCATDLCDLDTVQDYYKNSINCNFDEMCNNNT